MKRLIISLFLFFAMISPIYSQDLLTCRISSGQLCNSDESTVFYLNKNFYSVNNPLDILSSKVALNFDTNYNSPICCKVNSIRNLKIDFNSLILSTSNCPTGYKDLLYFTDVTNAKIGFPNSNLFNLDDYSNKICFKIPEQFSTLDILVNDTDYSYLGYTCLFKTKDLQNSLASSCDSTYGSNQEKYKYTVWARLWENTASLKCNLDCTSLLDNRVYTECSQKISSCQGTPQACNGAILNSFVSYNITHDVECSKPWNVFKSKTFTNEDLKINFSSPDKCLNLIKKKYSVILNNELVTMSVFICGD